MAGKDSNIDAGRGSDEAVHLDKSRLCTNATRQGGNIWISSLSTKSDLIVQSLYLLRLLQDLVAEDIQKIANISQRGLYACCSLTSCVEPMPEQPVLSFCLHQLLLGTSDLISHVTIRICLALRREWLIVHHLHSALLSQHDQQK